MTFSLQYRTPARRMVRDGQRQKCYDAERRAFQSPTSTYVTDGPVHGDPRRVLTRDEIVAVVARIMQDHTERPVSPHAAPAHMATGKVYPAEVRIDFTKRGGAHAKSHFWALNFAPTPFACQFWVVLHEVAHLLTPGAGATVAGERFGGTRYWEWEPGHGWRWVAVYIALVERYLGRAWAQRLRDECKAGRVRMKPKVERPSRKGIVPAGFLKAAARSGTA